MHWIDLVLVLILIGFGVLGWKRGTILTIGQVFGSIIGFLIARTTSPWLGAIIALFMPGRAGLAQLIAFIIIFFLIERLIGMLVGLVNVVFKIITKLPIISGVDKFLGFLFGLVEGIVFVGSSVYLIVTLRLDAALVAWLSGSIVSRYVQKTFEFLLGYFL
ncbi:MAG: CvpA family protein [Candidatus Uhrbacteria bacterium]|nr:CvpA family protein [Candidatus Uhrbacteria bacterium]MDP3793782.1 CvpA family protein [Candidatus Uhrbacteria bacterium]